MGRKICGVSGSRPVSDGHSATPLCGSKNNKKVWPMDVRAYLTAEYDFDLDVDYTNVQE